MLIWDDCRSQILQLWGSLLMSSGTLGITFGTTQGHQKGHLGPPWRTFETRHRKHLKKTLFWDLFWDSNLMTFRVFICPCFYMCSKRKNEVQRSRNVRKRVPKLHLFSNNSQIEKLHFDCAGASGSRVKAPRNR